MYAIPTTTSDEMPSTNDPPPPTSNAAASNNEILGDANAENQEETATGAATNKKRSRPPPQAAETNKRPRPTDRARRPFNRPSTTHLKRTGESFLQDGNCNDVAPRLIKCLECRPGGGNPPSTTTADKTSASKIFCRFYAFRRLRYTKNGILAVAGFADPCGEPTEADAQLWLPDVRRPPSDIGQAQALFLLRQVGDQFCELLGQEMEARTIHMTDDDEDNDATGGSSSEPLIAWKRVVSGVREMCDVCATSLFNHHWTCGKCGFVVCLDCYRSRRDGIKRVWTEAERRDHHQQLDDASWRYCVTRAPHQQRRMILTQIIAGDSLQQLGRLVHEIRAAWRIPQHCGCAAAAAAAQSGEDAQRDRAIAALIAAQQQAEDVEEWQRQGIAQQQQQRSTTTAVHEAPSTAAAVAVQPPNLLLVQPMRFDSSESEDDEAEPSGGAAMLRQLFRPQLQAVANSSAQTPEAPDAATAAAAAITADIILEAARSLRAQRTDDDQRMIAQGRRRDLPVRIMTLAESQSQYPDVPHAWLCDGRLLRLLAPANAQNIRPFQEQWKRGQPVLVSRVSDALNMALWCPEAFSRDFGEARNDLVNCATGCLVPNQPMKFFWDGFDAMPLRLRDAERQPMLLKLKDWPPGEDFAKTLPDRFADLMRHLPLGVYTKRTGRFNLASRLPAVFVRPDLGPKMYNAYGSALRPDHGTTNLHLDISDAVNVMVYVSVSGGNGSGDGGDSTDEHRRAAFRAVDEAGCDVLQRRRVRDAGEVPGAIWHIYAPRDADKIRDLLNKVAIERGRRLEPNHDPIHDQDWYLDGELRERLYREYSVEGYPIAQCRGDAVFIPAGAPHQVRNLHNCIKVAEDFVSPENVSHCFQLTQEFRQLTHTHSNHEDKLQIKNIIYHAVKDAVAVLEALMAERLGGGGGGDAQRVVAAAAETELETEIEPLDELEE